ncbi:dynein axonemal assembly factor 11 isoform X2 [Bacillus rossius redtenbacheri]|uniref:dynein axonemal assembly factor 11 isoform X2 n=1 Tax=Bacillus rossius redtenbacheri TaxID=93214 RepID=UPI002FDD5420
MSEISTKDVIVRITEDLVRRRSEHNDGDVCSLQELSLAQERVGKIEHLQNWCRDLRILLLQDNLIQTIENLGRLKRLQYLNLAVNCVERIDGLHGCESLGKLDLTLNFVGVLSSVASLRFNPVLHCLYLTGNPCTDYEGYRQYVVAMLPQLTSLDGQEISRSERIAAQQALPALEGMILRQQRDYAMFRAAQKERATSRLRHVLRVCQSAHEAEIKQLWESPSENCPEERLALAALSRRQAPAESAPPSAPVRKLRAADGRPLNINQAKIPFTLTEDESGCYVLDVAVYRHLDTALVAADVHPDHVALTIKGKLLQLVFPVEVQADRALVRRSQTTGHLQVIAPKVGAMLGVGPHPSREPQPQTPSSVDTCPDEADVPPLE